MFSLSADMPLTQRMEVKHFMASSSFAVHRIKSIPRKFTPTYKPICYQRSEEAEVHENELWAANGRRRCRTRDQKSL